MRHRFATNYAENYCNRTPIVKVIVENVVTCFFGGHSVYRIRAYTIRPIYVGHRRRKVLKSVYDKVNTSAAGAKRLYGGAPPPPKKNNKEILFNFSHVVHFRVFLHVSSA